MKKHTILLAEDSKTQADVTKDLLERSGYDVVWAENGASAMKAAKTEPIDVILLDVVMPDINGSEICKWLKADDSTKCIPIIMLSAKGAIEDKVAGIEVGADDYMPKPYNEVELLAKIYAALRTKALQDELRDKNRQLEETLHQVELLAVTDPLTGLFNRRYLGEALEKELKMHKRYGQPVACFMMDIDHFKAVNDNYGHKAGDSVLKDIARLLKNNLREVDIAARWGGEEFVVIMPRLECEDYTDAANRMREVIAAHRFEQVPERRITVSIGIACAAPSRDTNETLINAADMALLDAKRNGRNRVEIAD